MPPELPFNSQELPSLKTFYTLGRYVILQVLGGSRFIGIGSRQKAIDSEITWGCIIGLCKLSKKRTTLEHLRQYDKNSSAPGTLDFLLENHFVIPDSDITSSSRYSRTLYYYQSIGLDPETAQVNLKKATVTILGCGGIGNHIGASLVSNGVGTINLVDGDYVELTNLTRQILFNERDINSRKVEILAKRLSERNSESTINTLDLHINNEEDLSNIPSSDLFIVSADSNGIINLVNTYCLKNKISFVNVGYMNDIAVWGPFVIPGKTGCYACGAMRTGIMGKEKEDNNVHQLIDELNHDFKSATFPPVNASAAALATSDIIRYLSGSSAIASLNKRIGLHDFTLKVETQDFSKNDECSVCQNR